MTRKDYRLIAKAMKKAGTVIEDDDTAMDVHMLYTNAMAAALQKDNPRFNSADFFAACFAGGQS
jgi:hypothetical protein